MNHYDPERHHRRSIRLAGYDYTQAGAYFITICTHEREHLFGQVVDGQMILNPLGEIVWDEWFRSAQIRAEIELYHDEFVVMPNHIHGIVWIVATTPIRAHGATPTHNTSPPVGAHGGAPTYRTSPPVGAHGGAPTYRTSPPVGAHGGAPPQTGAPSQNDSPPPVGAHGGAPTCRTSPPVGAHGRAPLQDDAPLQDGAPLRMERPPKSLGSFVAGFKSAVTKRINEHRDAPGAPVWQRNYYEHIIRNDRALSAIREYIQNNPLYWHLDYYNPDSTGSDPLVREFGWILYGGQAGAASQSELGG